MFDTTNALADMARQIRECRAGEGLTLQQLALRSGVAASTIHKVETRQMVPTVSVLLKIARGLGRRADELIRDPITTEDSNRADASLASLTGTSPGGSGDSDPRNPAQQTTPAPNAAPRTERNVGVWQLDLSESRGFPRLELEAQQRAYVLVEQGGVGLRAGNQEIRMATGDCLEVEGGCLEATRETRPPETAQSGSTARVVLIVSPPGNLDQRLGARRSASPHNSAAAVA